MSIEWLKRGGGFLAKASYFFRPATLRVTRTTVLVTEDVATIHYTATVDRGLWLWFPKDGSVEFPTPWGLNLGTEIELRCEDREAGYRGVDLAGMVAKIGKAAKEARGVWKNRETIHVEVKTHCESRDLLTVFPSPDGDRAEIDGEQRTVFRIRKKSPLRDVVVKRLRWRKMLTALLPLTRIELSKNGQALRDTQIDVSYAWRSIAEVSKVQVSKIEPPAESGGIPILCSVEIPLSFEDAEDEYTITLYTGPLGGQ